MCIYKSRPILSVSAILSGFLRRSSLLKAGTVLLLAFCLLGLSSCAGVIQSQSAPLPVNVLLSATTLTLQAGGSHTFTVTLMNDPQNKGVNWAIAGTGCAASACGSLTNTTTTSATYNAPPSVPNPPLVNVQATSISDPSRSGTVVITLTAPPPISVSLNPSTISVQTSKTQNFTASLQNDLQGQGVTWSLTGCTGPACGTLTNVTSTTVTYTAPASVPNPATNTLVATSAADNSKQATAVITVTAAPPPISVSINPPSATVQVSQTANFMASLQNDSQSKGVTWSLSGAGCSGAACGTLTNITTTAVTYNAPATAPNPPSATLTTTSIADATKSAAAAISIITPPPPISVSVNPSTASVQVSQTFAFGATLQNDSQSKGVTWSLSGTGCSGAACGTLTNITTTAVTYNAPATSPNPASVTLTATSIADATKSGSAAITITAAPPPISVSVNPSTASVQVSQTFAFGATLQNDSQNKGVTWSLSGAGCSGAACGTLTNVTTASVTYNAPVTAPNPASVTLTATSIADATKSGSAAITITAAPPPISVSVNPPSASVQVSQSSPFAATLQNDSQGKGVTWSLSGTGCSGAACGTLTNITTTSVTYNAPGAPPTPPTVSLKSTSIADATKSASVAITITTPPPPISVSVNPPSASVQVSQTSPFGATLQNDSQGKGVTWSLSGTGCSGAACGTLTNVTITSVTYNAPATAPNPASVSLTATSIADATKSAAATITITTPPPISVSVSPTPTSIQALQTGSFTATLQNDSQNKGVTWTLSGAGCSGAACGTLTNVTTTSVTYNAPATPPSPPTVALKATSIADPTKSGSATITLTPSTTPPTTPSNLIATANGSSQIDLSWGPSSDPIGVSAYLLERCLGSGCSDFAQITSTSPTSFNDTGLASSTSYSYRVRATDSANNLSPYSNTASASTSAVSSGGSVPTLVWSKSAANTTGIAIHSYTSNLPTNGTLPGNVVIASFQFAVGSGASASVTDDKGDTFSLLHSNSNANQTLSTYCAIPTPGARILTITFSGGMPNFVSMVNASEWFNLTCSLDGSSANNGSSSSVSAGSFSTTSDGDLIYQAAEEDGVTSSETWTQGPSPWSFLSASRGLASANGPQAAQFQVQTTHGSISPSLSFNTADSWNSVAVALKSASSGTAPPAGIRILHLQEESVPPGQSSTVALQFPCSGNLLISATIDGPGFDVSHVSDSNGNTHAQIGSVFNDGNVSGDIQTFYVANAVTSLNMSITFSMTGSPTGGSTFFLYDVTGAASSPFDSAAGRQTASGSQSSSGNVAGPSITPSTLNGLVITQIAVTSNSIIDVSPGHFAATIPNPLGQTDPTNENNGWGFEYNTTTTPRQYIWTTQSGAVAGWSSTAVAFEAP